MGKQENYLQGPNQRVRSDQIEEFLGRYISFDNQNVRIAPVSVVHSPPGVI
jgi:hypothetical protein